MHSHPVASLGHMAGNGTPATAVLATRNVDHKLHSYEHDAAHGSYGAEAVDALGLDPARVFKTLVVEVAGKVGLVVGIVPMTGQLDTKVLAVAAGGKKATLADAAASQRATGYVLGGISPLGQRSKLATFIDSSVTGFDTVYISAGRRGLEIELAPHHLVRLTEATVADIARRR